MNPTDETIAPMLMALNPQHSQRSPECLSR